MAIPSLSTYRWTTASRSARPGTTPMELSSLGEHMALCHALRGRLSFARDAAQALRRFAAARAVTTGLIVAAAAGVLWWAA